MSEHTYEDLIAEAFIKPIRSVLIVDDDYPTLHEILLDKAEQDQKHGHKTWKSPEHRQKVRRVIDEFRRREAPFLLDIHDGSSPEEEKDEDKVGTLQQTDLLILDYQLDKKKEGDGAAAIRIAREALSNKHFNLILVHTQEPLERVFHEFLFGFMRPCFADDQEADPDEFLQSFLDDNEDQLLASVSDRQYAFAKTFTSSNFKPMQDAIQTGAPPWGATKELLLRSRLRRGKWLSAVKYALQAFEAKNLSRFAIDDVGVINWNPEHVMFIRAARGFVAFKSKEDGEELLPAMRRALVSWDPRPSRLMLTKLRAVMNERGIEVQDDALGKADVGAIWYRRLLEADDQNLNAIVDRTVRHHSEQLLDQLLPEVGDFAKRIRDIDAESDPIEAVKTRFSLDFSDEKTHSNAKMGHNAFVGSKPFKSAHLELGHIIKVEGEFWVCLTPACDMIPKVHRGRPLDRIEGVKRFTALKLFTRRNEDVLLDANRGGQIFANIATGPGQTQRMAFSATPKIGASPAWMTMYVQDDGYLPDVEGPICRVSYVFKPNPGLPPNIPIIRTEEATVCGMLRYEYALEIQSRFIASQSRIGLDFESSAAEDNDGEAAG
ncbi:response regulator receiver domain [Aurantimonas sp. E1-2-R+4]|uniref:response regulator receiver domain n=1 Tax=Aurantimonas sp. E1-2-R+4 TaxID=3113714 RepID=UPI002F953825